MKYLLYEEEKELNKQLRKPKKHTKEDSKKMIRIILALLVLGGMTYFSECKSEKIVRGIFGDCWVCKCGNEVYVDFNTCPVCGKKRGS